MAASEKAFIVAIELGSSKISGVAGRRNNDGTMQILAYATERVTAPCIKRGLVYNIDKTTQSISNIIGKLYNGYHVVKSDRRSGEYVWVYSPDLDCSGWVNASYLK